MKIAVLVDEQLLHEADRVATDSGVTRSQVFSMALEAYVRGRRHTETAEQLSRGYGSEPDTEEKRVTAEMKAKFEHIVEDRW